MREATMATTSDSAQTTLVERIADHKNALTLREFAELFSISYKTAFEMATRGRMPAMQIGSSWRLDPAVLAAWVREQALLSDTRALQPRVQSRRDAERQRRRIGSLVKRTEALARRARDVS